MNEMHNMCNINKLSHRREVHLLNFVHRRAHEDKFLQTRNRDLRRFDAPVLKEIASNNKSFERSVLYQGPIYWNRQPVEDRNTQTHMAFKKRQKIKLNTLLPYN